MKTTKKILGVVLALLMVLTMFPMAAMAATTTVNDLAELKAALPNGGTIKLGADITITGDTAADRLLITKTTTIDLNGHDVYVDTDGSANWTAFRVENDEATSSFSFTLKGQGTISSATPGEIYGVYVNCAKAAAYISDATFTDVLTAVQVRYGSATISSGTFKCVPVDEEYGGDYRFTLNCIDAQYQSGDASIKVKGGFFYNFNPADNQAEGAGTNFMNTGYTSLAIAAGNDTWYSVVSAPSLTYNTADNSVKVNFTMPSGADKFWVYGSTDGENYSLKTSTTSSPVTLNNGIVADSTYYAKVVARYVIDGKNYYANVDEVPVKTVATTKTVSATTMSQVTNALNNAQDVVLQDDISQENAIYRSHHIYFNGPTVGGSTLDLNGHTIDIRFDEANMDSFCIAGITNNKTSMKSTITAPTVITGEGTVNVENNACVHSNRASTNGIPVFVIENGTFTTNHDEVIYTQLGFIQINGGTFASSANDAKYTLNCLDTAYTAGTAGFIVTGGSFKNFNPAASTAEPNGPVNWVAEGYTVVTTVEGEDTWYTVVPEAQALPEVTLTYVDGTIVATGDTSSVAKAWIVVGEKIVGKTAETVTFKAPENYSEAEYVLRVKDNVGNYTDIALTAPAAPAAKAVTITSAVADDDSITVTWNAMDNADKYWLHVSYDNGVTYKIYAATAGTTYDFTRVTDGATYLFKVTARYTNELGKAAYTNAEDATAASATYTAPASGYYSEAYYDGFSTFKLYFDFNAVGGDKGWIIVKNGAGAAVKTIAITNSDTSKVVKPVTGVTNYGDYRYDIKVKNGTTYTYLVTDGAIATVK